MKYLPHVSIGLVAFTLLAACGGEDEATSSKKKTHHGSTTSTGDGGSTTTGAGGAGQGGAGQGGTLAESCDPYQARVPATEVLVGPTGLEKALDAYIDGATTSIDLMMYQLSVKSFIDGFIAAKNRGVTVRVMLDGDQAVNASSKSKLKAAGIEVQDAPAKWEHAHTKVMIIDHQIGVVMSGNMNSYTVSSERNYFAIDRSADDIADLQAVFDADWSGTPLDLSCTRLIVSPENSHERLLAHINGAKESLDLAIMYISDSDSLAAIKSRAKGGVPVRVLLASPAWISDNTSTAADLEAAGVQTKFLESWELHAKLIVADGKAFVGSENLSWTSLESNREVGVFVTEPDPTALIASQFEKDWAAGK